MAIITSAQAAALKDVLTTLARRAPHIPIFIYPTLVQGPDAPAGIIHALKQANQDRLGEVILLVRGGGSIEDLWAFNDEALAHAIANSSLFTCHAADSMVCFWSCPVNGFMVGMAPSQP